MKAEIKAKVVILLLCLAALCTCYARVQKSWNRSYDHNSHVSANASLSRQSHAEYVRSCVLDYIKTGPQSQKNLHLKVVTKSCFFFAKRLINLTFLQNENEVKVIIPFISPDKVENCAGMTLGVGGDINAELELRRLYPGCALYGADPFDATGKVFEEVGKFIKTGVGAADGKEIASVKDGRKYHKSEIHMTSIVNFFKWTGRDFFDFAWIDIEGYEFDVVPLLMQMKNVTVCQLNVEIHANRKYSISRTPMNVLLEWILEKTDFIILWANHRNPPDDGKYKTFFYNAGNAKCNDKFLPYSGYENSLASRKSHR